MYGAEKTKAGNSVTSKGKQNVSMYLCAHFCKDLHLFFGNNTIS